MADGVFNDDFVKFAAIVELDGKCVGDRAFVWVVVIRGKGWIFGAVDFVAEGIDAMVGCDIVFIICSG